MQREIDLLNFIFYSQIPFIKNKEKVLEFKKQLLGDYQYLSKRLDMNASINFFVGPRV